jgi:hypothetical protein
MYEYMQDVLCQVMEHNMQLKCWFCDPHRDAFLRSGIRINT